MTGTEPQPTEDGVDPDTKVCPRCAETVKAAALVCRFCGYEFAASPASPSSLPPDTSRPKAPAGAPEALTGTPRGPLVVLLALVFVLLLTVVFLVGRLSNGTSPTASRIAVVATASLSPVSSASSVTRAPAPVASELPSPTVNVTPLPATTTTPGTSPASTPPTTSVTLRVVRCPATFGGMGTLPAPPPTWDVTLPSDVALNFSFYGVQQTLVLAPKGWECSGLVGADGSYGITVSDPADVHAAVSVQGAPGAPYSDVLGMACPFFPDAAKKARATYPGMLRCTVPSGERVVRIDTTDVEFIDAPGIAGTGALSGLAYPVYGIVHYDVTGTSTVSCALPATSASLCKPIMDTFINNPF